jgi:exonuclease III
MLGPNLSIADWNTRGLNDQGRKDTVHAFLADTLCHIACIQETKLDHIDQRTASYIGGFRLRSYAHRPAIKPGEAFSYCGMMIMWMSQMFTLARI